MGRETKAGWLVAGDALYLVAGDANSLERTVSAGYTNQDVGAQVHQQGSGCWWD